MDPSSALPSTALVLVAVMTSPRDLEIARLLGWYRIPLRRAPKVVDVDYLAFYQTSGFSEEERGMIKYLAKVRGHELTTRAELLKSEFEHPHANEEYYKIQLGPLITLPQPIKTAGWKRITFLYTTGNSINNAMIVNDLVIHSEERDILWRSIRERMESGADRDTSYKDDLEISDEQLMEILGYVGFPGVT